MRLDWSTLVLQTVNVLVLLWLLRRFLFRPIIAIVAQRQAAAEKLMADAAAARVLAQAQVQEAAQHQKALAADSERILSDARTSAAAERAAVIERSNLEAAEARDAAQQTLRRQREQMRQELRTEACQLAMGIASRLLERLPTPAVTAALLQSLDGWLATLSADELKALVDAGDTLQVVTAAPLDAETQAKCGEMLRHRLGRMPALRFGIDPSLIAGVELRGSHLRLHNNWRADLSRIAEELGQDVEHLAMA